MFDRPVDNVFAAALLGSRYDSTSPNAEKCVTTSPLNRNVTLKHLPSRSDGWPLSTPTTALEKQQEHRP